MLLLNSNTIKCQACQGEFEIDEKNLTPNLRLQSLINKDVHLTSREKSMKKSLEDSLKTFFDLLSQVEQSIRVSISESQRHFAEIRRKIVVQQNKLKTKIDNISMDMIEQTNKMEGEFNSVFECISIDKSAIQTYDEKIQHLNETFRNVNLSHDTLKQMLSERNAYNSDMQSKQNQLNEINDHLKASNIFKPISNLTQSTFGNFSLVPYTNDPFKSRILSQAKAKFVSV